MSFILLLKAQESAFSFAVFNHFIIFANINLIRTTHGKDKSFILFYGGDKPCLYDIDFMQQAGTL